MKTYRAGLGYDLWLAGRMIYVSRDVRGAYRRLHYCIATAKHWRRRSWWKAWLAEDEENEAGAGAWTERGAVAKLRRKLDLAPA